VWRSILFAAAVLVLWLVHVRVENAEARKREDTVAHLIEELRVMTADIAEAGWEMDVSSWRSSSAYQKLISLDVRAIPLMLQHIDREAEAVGRVLAQGVAELGKLTLTEADWTTKEAWQAAWNAQVDKAKEQVPIILADQRLNASEQAAQLADLGIPALPHLLGKLQMGRGSEAEMLAIRQLLGPSYDQQLPSRNDKLQWQRWARSHAEEYTPLTYKFE